MHSRLVSWSRYVFLAGMVLALILVVPTAWFPFQLAKVAVFGLCLFVAAILFAVGGGVRDLWRTHGLWGAMLVALLPLSYVFSSLFSMDRSIAVLGYGIETDTIVFTTLAFLAFLLSFTMFRTLRTARMLSQALFWALIVAAAFQLISIIFGSIPFQTFADRSVNLVGKWNDLGLLLGLVMMFLLVKVEFGITNMVWKCVYIVLGVVLLLLLGVINFAVAWAMILVGAIVMVLLKFITQRFDEGTHNFSASRIPWYAGIVVIFSILFLLFGSQLNNGLTSLFPVSSLEVRPSLGTTFDVINAAHMGSVGHTFFGTGPNTFGESWLMHKPAEVNQSAFWSLDFNVGFSTLATALGSVGFVGAAMWLVPLLLLLAALVRAVRLGILSSQERVTAILLGVGGVFMMATLIFYVPSQNTILLAFVLAGAAFGFLWRQGQQGGDDPLPYSRMRELALVLVMIALLVLSSWTGLSGARRFIAQAYINQGSVLLGQNLIDEAIAKDMKAQKVERTSDALRLMIDSQSAKAASIAADNKLNPDDARAAFANAVQGAINAGADVIQMTPGDYRPHLALARLYDYLSTLNIQGAYESAKQKYVDAAKLNPSNPTIPLLQSKLEASKSNAQLTQDFLKASLTLKPNYTDAILFVVQLDVANKDLVGAVQAATIAAQTAPGVAPIWFQLGLLYYAGGDTKDAIPALEKAIQIQSDYANAKYFLGLSYYAQKRPDDALKLFEDLKNSNPDNAEVTLILSNMRAGKSDPFANETPPQPAPQKRTTAPVSE